MSFTVTATFATAQEAANFLAGVGAPQTTAVASPDKSTGKPKAEKTAPVVASSEASAPTTAPASNADAKPEADKPKIDYPTLQKAVFKLAGIPVLGRPAAKALSESFGVATFKELDPSKWDAALAATEAKIVEVEAKAKTDAEAEAVA